MIIMNGKESLINELYNLFLMFDQVNDEVQKYYKNRVKMHPEFYRHINGSLYKIKKGLRELPLYVRNKIQANYLEIMFDRLLTLFEYKSSFFGGEYYLYHADELDLNIFNNKLLELIETIKQIYY